MKISDEMTVKFIESLGVASKLIFSARNTVKRISDVMPNLGTQGSLSRTHESLLFRSIMPGASKSYPMRRSSSESLNRSLYISSHVHNHFSVLSERRMRGVHLETVRLNQFSNESIFRHRYIGDRKISMIDPRLPDDVKSVISNEFSRMGRLLYALLELLTGSKCPGGGLSGNIMAFRKNLSCLDHARKHINGRTIIAVDISRFYDSLSLDCLYSKNLLVDAFRSYFEMFTKVKYSEDSFYNPNGFWLINNAINTICLHLMPYLSFLTHNSVLPTGMPYSPSLSNIAMLSVDSKIVKHLSSEYGDVSYSRYADDMCISTPEPYKSDGSFRLSMDAVLKIEGIVNSSGLFLKYEKTKIMGPRDKKVVAGVVIDQSDLSSPKLSIGSERKKELFTQMLGRKRSDLTTSEVGILAWVRSVNRKQHQYIVSGLKEEDVHTC